MGIKAFTGKVVAGIVARQIRYDANHAPECQKEIFSRLIKSGRHTKFGRIHDFQQINSIEDYQKRVPVTDYEGLKTWIEESAMGTRDVLWPGLPVYLAKTSGTTSGNKYIPITKDSVSNHISSARNALLMYIDRTGNSRFLDHKMIFLQGSPVLEKHGVIPTGRLSGIAAHFVPFYLQKNRLPSYKTNCMENWEAKVDAVVNETIGQRMSVISGIPSWLLMYFERLTEKAAKPVGEIFPDLQLLAYGGVNFEPYRPAFNKLLGREIDTIEVFPASEGFFAFQDLEPDQGLLLNVNSGIFYEFIPLSRFYDDHPERLTLREVSLNTDYALIVSSNAGLWSYSVGDTIRFVSLNPYRIIVSGRVSQFISAFGEHVIASEIEGALSDALKTNGAHVAEFTVAPLINPAEGKSRHQWLIEFDKKPADFSLLANDIERALMKRNSYYNDLITGNVLDPLEITELPKGTFNRFMQNRGKLGGQNKIPHLSNDRAIADELLKISL